MRGLVDACCQENGGHQAEWQSGAQGTVKGLRQAGETMREQHEHTPCAGMRRYWSSSMSARSVSARKGSPHCSPLAVSQSAGLPSGLNRTPQSPPNTR